MTSRVADEPVVVALRSQSDLAEASELYRRVFGYVDPATAINTRLLGSMVRYGGVALGAREGSGRMIAFGYGWTGLDHGRPFHYSQAVVIDPAWQSRGLGRRIKLAQRDLVLAEGITEMRWSFDPMLGRNAHFNLDVLGAVGHETVSGLFGPGEDRLVVGWDLTGGRFGLPASIPGLAAEEVPADAEPGDLVEVAPRRWVQVVPAIRRPDPELGASVTAALMADHRVPVSARRIDADRTGYLLVPDWRAE